MAGMPQLVKLQDELKDTGFTIIAPHSQDVPKEKVLKLLKQNKVNYVVTSRGDVPGQQVSTLPAAFLFDSNGNFVERGNLTSLKLKIHKLVETEPHFLAAGRKYTKLAGVAESLKKTQAYGQILKRLEKDLKSDGAAGEEAKYLTERITAHGEKLLARAEKLEGEDAFKAQQTYSELSSLWRGSKVGEKAAARVKELKADKKFQEEVKASSVLNQILAECDKLVWQGKGEISLEGGNNKKIAATVSASAEMLKKKFAGSKAAGRVDSELAIYGFKKA